MAGDKKAFSWDDEDKAAANPSSKGKFSWGDSGAEPNIASESEMAAHPPTAKPVQMEAQSPTMAKLTHIAANQRAPGAEEIGKSSVGAAKFGTEALGVGAIGGPLAGVAESHVLPALKAVPWVGRVVSAVDEAPGIFGKALRGATVGGATGGVEGAIRSKGDIGTAAEDAGKGALLGGAMGLALPAIHHLSGPSKGVYPGAPLPSVDEFYENRGAELNKMRTMNEALDRRMAREARANAPEPPLGSPENPGFMSKLPARLPPSLRGDPFSPTPAAYKSPIGSIASEEGVPGSLPRPSGRLIVLPQEAQSLEQLQRIATRRASEHGMQYAAGMRPAGGGRVPATPTAIQTEEYPQNPIERLQHVNRITLNPIGAGGARPLTENQFESSFGPEHREVGDLAEWETGSREGVRPRKVLVP